MKTFNQLTALQQEEAILKAQALVEDLLDSKMILSDRPVEKVHLRDYAEAAAMNSFYTEVGDMVFDGVA